MGNLYYLVFKYKPEYVIQGHSVEVEIISFTSGEKLTEYLGQNQEKIEEIFGIFKGTRMKIKHSLESYNNTGEK